MSVSIQKAALRKHLLEKRDATSAELREISSDKICKNLKQIDLFNNSENIASYFPIGSEVNTNHIMLDILEQGKNLLLPKVVGDNLEFYTVPNLKALEKGSFDIMEPKDICKRAENIDCVLVPTVGISKSGSRLGYGNGYYDKFLADKSVTKIALTYNKQIVKSIPSSEHDIKMDWIISESESILISE